MAASTSVSSSKIEYLRKYGFVNEEEKKKKKKKKKTKPVNNTGIGVVVVDEDPVWHKPVVIEEEDNDEAAEDTPQVDVDIEVKRMRRLEQIRSRRPFGSISEDGSGWISVNDTSQSQIPDMSPPRRGRLDTPSPIRENSDLSPPHKQRARNDSPSPQRMLKQSTTVKNDLSPPRIRRAHNDSSSLEAVGRSSKGASADLSPPRKRRARNDSPSPDNEAGPSKVAAADLSPPRRHQNQDQSSPPPRRRQDTPSGEHGNKPSSRLIDLSPPRKKRISKGASLESELMPSDSRNNDFSPPRKRRARNDSSSPEAVGRSSKLASADLSPPRRGRARNDSVSPRDKLHTSTDDLSPVRKPKKDKSVSEDRFSRRSQNSSQNDAAQTSFKSDLSPPRKHPKGTSIPKHQPLTGLVTGQDVKEEIAKTQKADWSSFNEMDPAISGRGAEPVYRDKLTGKRMTKEEFLKSQKKKEEKPKEIKLEWGKGLSQKREAEARLQELEEEKHKPFARSRDDPDLDKEFRERVRWGDPMAHLVKKKQFEPVLPNLGDDDRMKESGFIVPQDIPKHSWIKRGLDAAPNRYNIKPGRHWDGVDRSNGFEKAMFKRTNEKEATQKEAYLWSVSDM